jgi:hypothetical protein
MMPTNLELPKGRETLDKIRLVVRKMAFLMPHQAVLPDVREALKELESWDKNNPDYVLGAYHALSFLLDDLEGKGY